MHVQFEHREHRVPASNRRVELRAAVVSNDGRLDGLTYDVETASDPAVEVRWAVSGPSSLEPGQDATIVVTLELPASMSRHPALTVRLTVTGAGGRSKATAETLVHFGDDRCAAFPARPSLTLSPDGSVTGSLVLVNCGPFKISVTVSARRGDGSALTIDRPEITLAAGDEPISVACTLRPSDGRGVAEHEQIRLELISDGTVLASTQASVAATLSPPRRRGIARKVRSAAGAVLVLALAIAIVANWPSGSPPDRRGTGTSGGGTSEKSNGPAPAAKIESFTVAFLPDNCATRLEWAVTEGAGTTLVRRHDDTETNLDPVDSPFTDDLSAIRDADGSIDGTVAYELIAESAGGSDSRMEQVEVQCDPQLPDLIVADISSSGVTVGNVGDGTAGPFVVLINGTAFDSGGLAVGDAEQIAIDLCEGPVDVVVDPRNAVMEADEANNDASDVIIC